jgi:hypothetical protein
MSWTGSQRAARTGLGVLAACVVVAATGAIALTHSPSAHAGEHFVGGHADPRDVTVDLWPGGRRVATSEGLELSDTCVFDGGTVLVPVRLSVTAIQGVAQRSRPRSPSVVAEGWVTLHVTATVSRRTAGDELVASVTEDFAMRATRDGDWVHIPLDDAQWRHGANECAITQWTMTPGAWLSNDD